MKKSIIASLFLLVSTFLISTMSADEPQKIKLPDFAYPQDALKTAEELIQSKNRGARVLGVLEYNEAKKDIEYGSLPDNMKFVEELAGKENDDATKALLMLQAAQIGESFKYNRSLCQAYSPDSPTLEIAQSKLDSVVTSLYDNALELASSTPLTEFADAFEWNTLGLSILPTVRDFVAWTVFKDSPSLKNKALDKLEKDSPAWFALNIQTLNLSDEKKLKYLDSVMGNPKAFYAIYRLLQSKNSKSDVNIPWRKEVIPFLTRLEPIAKGSWLEPVVNTELNYYRQPIYDISLNKIDQNSFKREIILTTANIDSLTLTAYLYKSRSDAQQAINTGDFKDAAAEFEKTIRVSSTSEGDVFVDTLTFNPGFYCLFVSQPSPEKEDKREYSCIEINPYKFISLQNDGKKRYLQILDTRTGDAAKDIRVMLNRNDKVIKEDCQPDENGCIMLPNLITAYQLSVQDIKTGFTFFAPSTFYPENYNQDRSDVPEIRYSVTPDRPIYRPGETARLALVISQNNKTISQRKLTAEIILPVKASARRANNEQSQKISVGFEPTDEFGRSVASVVIPEDCELGMARIVLPGSYRNIGTINIAEFKLNDLKITNLTDRLTADSVIVTGMATNSAGVGVKDVKIDAEAYFYTSVLSGKRLELDENIRHFETKTDDAGLFMLTLPRIYSKNIEKFIKGSGNNIVDDEWEYAVEDEANSNVNISLTAMAPNGRSANTSYYVDTEWLYNFTVNIPDLFINSQKGQNIVVGLKGHNAPEHYEWSLTDTKGDKTVASGKAKVGVLNLGPSILKGIKPGVYDFTVSLSDSTARSNKTEITVYNPKSNTIPGNNPFLVLENSVSGANPSITIGVKNKGTKIWCYYQTDEENIILRPLSLKQGFNTVKLDIGKLPNSIQQTRVSFYCIASDLRSGICEHSVTVTPIPEDTLTLSCESFRDKVSAGTDEKWQFVTRLNKRPTKAAVFINVMNSKLLQFGIPSVPSIYRQLRSLSGYIYTMQNYYDRYHTLNFRPDSDRLLYSNLVSLPGWRGLFGELMSSGAVMLETASVACGMARNEHALDMAMVEEEADDGEVKYAQRKVANLTGSVKIRGTETPSPTPKIEIREPKVYTALWAPMLTTGIEGVVDVSFTVPGESTQWSVAAEAWTTNLQKATINHLFTAERDLIVAPNAPRFVRVGDCVNLVAAITNNTDSVMNATAYITVLSDSIALQDFVSTLTIEPHSTAYVNSPVKVEVTGGELEYTVRVSDGVTGDGERNSIPVLPSSALVTESRNFYINPGQEDYPVTLPTAEGTDFSTELHYTTNPMWTVVESLPKAIEPWCEAASAIAMSVYSSRTALELSKQFPEAKDVINLTDAKKYAEGGLKKLKKMQTDEGGFKWAEWATAADRYSTLIVLDWLASVNSEDDVSNLTKPALDFVDKTSVGKDGKIYPDFFYTVVRSFYGMPKDQNGSRVVNATVKDILKNWKSYSIDQKALAAIALKNYGYDKMAKTVLGSLRQFGRRTADRGYEFPNMPNILAYTHTLEAFASVEPKADIVSGIVQHLLYIRQGMDWGSSSLTTYAVRSIMEAASSWVVKPSPVSVKVDGMTIDAKLEGTTAGTINAQIEGRELTVNRPVADYPAYGAVVSTFIAPLSDIKPFSDGEVKIKKTIVRIGSDGKETPLGTDTKVTPGEKLSVVLLVTSKRPLSNLVLTDMRPAAFEPVVQVPRMIWNYRTTPFYLENRDAVTNIYVDYIPAGTSQFTYEVTVNNTGTFTTGQATVASAIAPDLTAHSGSAPLTLTNM